MEEDKKYPIQITSRYWKALTPRGLEYLTNIDPKSKEKLIKKETEEPSSKRKKLSPEN